MSGVAWFSIYVDDLAKSCSSFIGSFIVLYADDIFTPSTNGKPASEAVKTVREYLISLIWPSLVRNVAASLLVRGRTIHVLVCVDYVELTVCAEAAG